MARLIHLSAIIFATYISCDTNVTKRLTELLQQRKKLVQEYNANDELYLKHLYGKDYDGREADFYEDQLADISWQITFIDEELKQLDHQQHLQETPTEKSSA